MITCQHCDAQCKGHKWGKIKAGDGGWFFMNDGRAYCPRHVPEWVATWRARRDARKGER